MRPFGDDNPEERQKGMDFIYDHLKHGIVVTSEHDDDKMDYKCPYEESSMKILLTQHYESREPRTPIALLDLAAYGRSFGHDITVAYSDEMEDLSRYDLVGYSAIDFSHDIKASLESLRRRCSKPIVLGGKAVNALLEEDRDFLRKLDIDTHRGDGERIFNGNNPIDFDIYPAWSPEDFRRLDKSPNIVEAMSSRGCPYHCHFCNNTEPKVSCFNPERTAAHAKMLLCQFGRSRLFFVDDIFALRSDRMMTVLGACDCAGVDIRGKVCFFVHVNHLSEKILDAIDAIHPMEMQMGVESGDDEMLAAMGKTFYAQEAEDRLRELCRRGHRVVCLFLMGFPGETKESLQRTVDFVNRNRQYMSGWWVSYYQPVPFTQGWKLACERLGHRVTGCRNDSISYLDPNLTELQLREARHAVMLY